MFYEYVSLLLGIIKIFFYKCLYCRRIIFKSFPKMNCNFKIAIKKKSVLKVGKNFRSRNNVSFRIYNGGTVQIGENCFFNDNCSINCQKEIIVGNNVICGQNVMFFDHDHDYKNNIDNFVCDKIVVGDNVWIGANVTILKGVKIGSNVVIGAGTLVKEDIENDMLVYQDKKVIKKITK